ncbi:MAG: InlB B-repeat-containing protein [Clostridia bacterium]|nr:InlB B-repeat-containing protein [Clostridia bacterium]
MKKLLKSLIISVILALFTFNFYGCISVTNIMFESNGAGTISTRQYFGKQEITELPTPERTFFDFDCWCFDSTLNNKVELPRVFTGNVTLYAKYSLRNDSNVFNAQNQNLYNWSSTGLDITVNSGMMFIYVPAKTPVYSYSKVTLTGGYCNNIELIRFDGYNLYDYDSTPTKWLGQPVSTENASLIVITGLSGTQVNIKVE